MESVGERVGDRERGAGPGKDAEPVEEPKLT